MDPLFSIVYKKAIHGKALSSISSEGGSLYQRARPWSLGLWRNDSYGCDTERGDSQLRGLLQDIDRPRKRFERLRPHGTPKEILLQQGCTQVLRKNGADITKFVWAVLTHPPFSPDLPPPYFNLFGALKGAILDTNFETKGYVMSAVRNWLHEQDKAWYRQGTYTHVPRWCRSLRETLWGKKKDMGWNHHSS